MTPPPESPAERLTRLLDKYGQVDIQSLMARLEAAEAEVTRLTQQREEARKALAAIEEGRERIHARFRDRSVEGKCVCPYCSRDADALAELAADYELSLHSKTEALKQAQQFATRAALLQAAEEVNRRIKAYLKSQTKEDEAGYPPYHLASLAEWLTTRAKESEA